ncbi:DUF4255 domain-containing protein [Calothrix sp. 336/3]|uniref:DUF4255 domain-containing protein n=1 Tax=Calothrix sp. 336/3 TaxID=1337936 RepID=UPI0004E42B63|nr:DUF4255 domain-containing protein [Calothrix sp. 336/3]AKG20495.1 hypothetical protein IJ00_03465 [Calothrix sp. 336/3]
MSNYLAVATVTAILQRILQAAVQSDIDGVRVTTVQPRNIGNGTPETGINLYMYQVARNPALNNADTSNFRSKGTPIKRQTALDLYYIISFYGNDTELEPQRLLGSVTRTFNDRSTITPELIEEAIRDPTYRFLADSNLAQQIQHLAIVPVDMSLDNLSKVWSVFFQAPYLLSLVYKVTVMMIDGEESLRRSLPVANRQIGGAVPFPQRPTVEQVVSSLGKLEPILADSSLSIRGQHLASHETLVKIAGFELSPSQVTDNLISLSLAHLPIDFLRAGVQGLQVVHRIPIGDATVNRGQRPVESNVAPFVLRPTIKTFTVTELQGLGEEVRSLTLSVQVDVVVGKKQRAILIMNEWSTTETVGYQFEANPRNSDVDTIDFTLTAVKPTEYLLRLQIDGAESLLTMDNDTVSPTYGWFHSPRVSID